MVACTVEGTKAIGVHSLVETYNLVVAHMLAIQILQAKSDIH